MAGVSLKKISRAFLSPTSLLRPMGLGWVWRATWNILQSHRAGVDVASQLGEGTSFMLTFERAQDRVEDQP